MVTIRLLRIGAKKHPFYRIVVIDSRRSRGGKYLELLGTYNPLTEPKEIILKQERIDYWQKQGAQLSDGFLRMTKKAPQKPPRKPKKEKVEKGAEISKEEKPEDQNISESVNQSVGVSEDQMKPAELEAEAPTDRNIDAPIEQEEEKNEGST